MFEPAPRVQCVDPSLTLQINAEAVAMERCGEAVANLGMGEPDFDTPPFVKAAAHAAIDDGYTGYTAVDGYPALKRAVCAKLWRDNALRFEPEQVMITCGAKQALYDVCQTVLRPGDEAVIPCPYWVTYPAQVKLAEATPRFVAMERRDGRFTLDPAALEASLNASTRLVFLNSPHNPTGRVFDRDELGAVAEVLRGYPDVQIVSDDIYEHIRWTGTPYYTLLNVAPDLAGRYFVVNGVSKAYAMTGWRVGYVAGPEDALAAMRKVQGQSTAGTSSISQHAAAAALTGDQACVSEMVAAFKRRHDRIVPALDDLPGVHCPPSDGTFYAFPDFTEAIERCEGVDDDMAFAERLLREAEVAIVPGSGFGAPGHMRISFAAAMETIEEALARLRRFL